MNLKEQVQVLYKEAPRHGVPTPIMEKAVVPVLLLFANQLQHATYFVFQTRDRSWLTATLSHKDDSSLEKTVVYAFAHRKDATSFQGIANPNIGISSIPATHLLFQLFAMNRVDSIIFMETSGNLEQGKEIERKVLQTIIQQQIRRLKLPPLSQKSTVPPNWA